MQQNHPLLCRFVRFIEAFALTLLLSIATLGHAQVAGTGTIQGTITDASGAVIPNATVTLVDESTQVTQTAKTDGSGVYVFPNIDIGTYSLTIASPGFETYTKTGNVLEVGSNISLNVKMTVGSATEKVEVKSEALALQTDDVSFKQTIDQTAVTEMPLNGRQMTGLITLSGGSAPAPGGDFTGSKYSYAAISVSIAGGNGNTTTWKLDGGDNNDWMANSNLPFPFPDAVTQFSVESTALGAQDGIHSGGLVNVVTRSGTNRFHGSGFEFIRNNFIDAVNFFSTCTPVAPKTTCTAKDTLHQNQYGFTFGGPVLLPKLFNGRDRLFFFVGYQFEKSDSSSATSNAYVPTAANLAGDFSTTDPAPTSSGGTGVATTCSGVEQLYDPITGALLPGNKYPTGTAPVYNSAALALLAYLPKVAPLADGSDACGHVAYAIPNLLNDKQLVTRVDYTINSKNQLYGRYFLDGYQSPAPYSPNNILYTTQSGNVERVQTFTIGENWTISSKTVNSIHASVSRRVNNRGYNASDINLSNLGIPSSVLFQLVKNGLQLTNTTSGKNHGFTIGGGTNSVSHFNDNAFSGSDDVTMVRGKHQIVFGGEYVRNQLNISNAYESNGTETFNGLYSSNGPTGTGSGVGGTAQAAAGDANLDFLWGSMSAFQQSKQQQNALRAPIPSLYVQDTFHATPRLTMVAGVRWEPEYYPHDYFDRGTSFNMADFLANTVSTVYPNAPAGALFYGDPGVSRSFTKSSPWQFSPNIGLSFDPSGNGKTVLRGGFELAYDEVNFFNAQRNEQNPPYATASSPNTPNQLCFSNPWLIGGTGFGCGQVGGTNVSPYPTPQLPTPATAIFPAQSQYIFLTPQFHPSSTAQWTASVQHDFAKGWQLQLDYIGNKTSHSPIGYPMSNAVFIPGNYTASGVGCGPIATSGPASIFTLYKASTYAAGQPCSTTANYQSRFLLTTENPAQGNGYVGGGGGTTLVGDFATANYNGLVTSVNHRLSSTFSLLANWTWSKCLNEVDASGDYAGTSVSNPLNIASDYGPCGSDYRHIENVVLVAKSEFAFSNRIEKAVLDDWEFAPLVHIQSGGPFSVTEGKDEQYTDNSTSLDRANQVPGVPVYIHIANRSATGETNREYLNPAAFVLNNVVGTFGDTSRNEFRGIPSYQVDSQVSRIFPIHESLALDLRLEAFNMLNHPNFSNPSASNPASSNSTFGQISGTSNNARVFQGAIKVTF
jgi:hypothetical protein